MTVSCSQLRLCAGIFRVILMATNYGGKGFELDGGLKGLNVTLRCEARECVSGERWVPGLIPDNFVIKGFRKRH